MHQYKKPTKAEQPVAYKADKLCYKNFGVGTRGMKCGEIKRMGLCSPMTKSTFCGGTIDDQPLDQLK